MFNEIGACCVNNSLSTPSCENVPNLVPIISFPDQVSTQAKSLQKRIKQESPSLNWPKAKEAEDLHAHKRISRSSSLPSLSELRSLQKEEEACQAYDGHLWKCSGRRPVSTGGWIYEFESRYNFSTASQLVEVTEMIFPAVEESFLSLRALYNHRFVQACQHLIKKLGYRFFQKNGNAYRELPDREAALSMYQKIREDHPELNLPNAYIHSSKGIADDTSYALAHLEGGVLSTEGEFVHDHDAHVFHRFMLAFRGKRIYEKYQWLLNKQIYFVFANIYMATEQNSELKESIHFLHFFLGMTADTLYSLPLEELELTKDTIKPEMTISQIEAICYDTHWQKYLTRRFPGANLTGSKAKALWIETENAAKKFIKERKIITQFKTDYRQNFLDLAKKGFSTEKLLKLDRAFLKWFLENSSVLDVCAKIIYELDTDQQKLFLKRHSQIIELTRFFPIEELLTLKSKFPFEKEFDEDFWNLKKELALFILKNQHSLQTYNSFGIFIKDIAHFNADEVTAFFQNEMHTIIFLTKEKVILENYSLAEKWFILKHREASARFIQNGISIKDLLNLKPRALQSACANPARLIRLIESGVTMEAIASLSKSDQDHLIIFSESIVPKIKPNISIAKLSALAQDGQRLNF